MPNLLNPYLASALIPPSVPGLILWFDANDPANNGTRPANNSTLATWVNKTGSGINFTQTTPGFRPFFQTNQINGLPAIEPNAARWMQIVSVSSSTLMPSTRSTMFIVYNLSANNFFFEYQDLSTNKYGFNTVGNLLTYDLPNDSTGRLSLVGNVVNTPTVLTLLKTATSQEIYLKNILIGSKSNSLTLTPFTQNFFLFRAAGGGSIPTGKFSEIIMYNTDLTSQQMTTITNYLTTKWGL